MASSVDAKLLKQTKFPPEFNQKVDMKKVNVEVMKKWIAGKISEILGNEDDVVIELCFNLLEGSRFPDIKVLQIQLTGFLDRDTAKFCKELWNLCLSAQSNPQGVPKELLEAKKLELIQEKIDAEKAAAEAQRRKEQEKQRDRNIDLIRQRERGERGRGRSQGDRGGRDFDRRPPPPRNSRSPPPRRRSPLSHRTEFRGPPPRREIDTYIPGTRVGRRSDERRRPSPSPSRSLSRSRSRSVTPPRQRRRREDNWSPRHRHRGYSLSRSPSPVRRENGRGRGRGTRGGDRARSFTPSETSRSRSRRRYRKRRSPSILSRSPSPVHRSRQHRRRQTSHSPPRSPSELLGKNRRRSDRARRSISYTTDNRLNESRADRRKGPRYHDSWHRSHSKDRSRAYHSKSRSRSPRSERHRDKKRYRSIQRYEPAGRRRRNTSSASPPDEKKRKKADSLVDEGRPPPEPLQKSSAVEPAVAGSNEEGQSPTLTATELRERLLRKKVMALRKGSIGTRDEVTEEA